MYWFDDVNHTAAFTLASVVKCCTVIPELAVPGVYLIPPLFITSSRKKSSPEPPPGEGFTTTAAFWSELRPPVAFALPGSEACLNQIQKTLSPISTSGPALVLLV